MTRLSFVPGDCRIAHEAVSEGLLEVRVEYSPQALPAGRRTLSVLSHMHDHDDESEAMDRLHETAGRRPLV